MYVPKHFEEQRPAELQRLMREHPLGVLVLHGEHGLDANHIPFEVEVEGDAVRLLAHVARNNPLWREARDGQQALVIFRAGDAYVSPNWYPSKHEFHKQVPTWNYQAVHAHGPLTIHDDEKFVRAVVARLTRDHETRAGEARPWKMTDSSREYIDQMVAAVVGIEIIVERLEGKWKLSQNKEARDRQSAARELEARGDTALAAALRATLASEP